MLLVIPQLLWALVPRARDARPSCVKGQTPPPPQSGLQVQATPSQMPGRKTGDRATVSDFTR